MLVRNYNLDEKMFVDGYIRISHGEIWITSKSPKYINCHVQLLSIFILLYASYNARGDYQD